MKIKLKNRPVLHYERVKWTKKMNKVILENIRIQYELKYLSRAWSFIFYAFNQIGLQRNKSDSFHVRQRELYDTLT